MKPTDNIKAAMKTLNDRLANRDDTACAFAPSVERTKKLDEIDARILLALNHLEIAASILTGPISWRAADRDTYVFQLNTIRAAMYTLSGSADTPAIDKMLALDTARDMSNAIRSLNTIKVTS